MIESTTPIRTTRVLGILALLALSPPPLSSQDVDDLAVVSLETLMEIEVSSVSRREELLRDTAAAAYVITAEDIRRSGARDLADVLRVVPGLHVARIDRNTWAISARGFAAEYATKLLVIVDGRSVYDPTFSGVFWHLQNLVLEDIERIEVIRGPGATMWGANAVNGVISITTRHTDETIGGLVVAEAGSNDPGSGVFRYGARLGDSAAYRVFGRQTSRRASSAPDGSEGRDAWNVTAGGFRLDWRLSETDAFTISGEAYRGVLDNQDERLVSMWPPAYETIGLETDTGGHALLAWDRSLGGSSDVSLQVFYDRRSEGGSGAKNLETLDVEFQHDFDLGERHDIVWGGGHREIRDAFAASLSFSLDPSRERTHLSNFFVQDDITIAEDTLYLSLGSKLERSSFSGFNVQPSARLVWHPTFRQSVWAAVSRAVRTPNRVERGMRLNVAAFPAGRLPGLVSVRGHEAARSEELTAYEAGYRYQANSRLWLDVTGFYNDYDHLSVVYEGETFFETAPGPPHLVFPLYFGNDAAGKTYGVETAAGYELSAAWSLEASYSFLEMSLREGMDTGAAVDGIEDGSPSHQFRLASNWTLPRSFEVSAQAHFVGGLPADMIPSYTRIDLNLSWKGLENMEFSLSGQNLLGRHTEFGDLLSPANPVGRDVFGKVSWRF